MSMLPADAHRRLSPRLSLVPPSDQLPDMTDRQAIFDFVVRKLWEQGRPSLNLVYGGLVCRYRGAEGTRCAAGWLIPDADYRPEFEARPTRRLPPFADLRPGVADLVRSLQFCHDDSVLFPSEADQSGWWGRFEERARTLAKEVGLTFPVLNPKEKP